LIDKAGPGAGATGVACGCVRNLYMTSPLHTILRHSVDVWQSDPVNFGFQQVGYVSVGEANQTSDYETMHKSQNAAGYPSDLYVGKEAKAFLKRLWPDFNTEKADCVCTSGPRAMPGPTRRSPGSSRNVDNGASICARRRGPGLRHDRRPGHRGRHQSGHDPCRLCRHLCRRLGAQALAVARQIVQARPPLSPTAASAEGQDMWTFWRLLEGEVYLDGTSYRTADDRDPPVLHVELMNTPVISEDGREFPDQHFYTYVRYAAERVGAPGVQGGTIPIKLGPEAILEPYGHANPHYQADPWFADYYCATLAYLMDRFKGCRRHFKERANGGIGAFTPDNVPIFDWVAANAYMVADSNHGFKMIGVGKLLAEHLITGKPSPSLARAFALDRYAQGRTFGDRNSNCPWV
jgi:methylglutamate dehydrogenase subunit A